jgi:hypothetical protein
MSQRLQVLYRRTGQALQSKGCESAILILEKSKVMGSNLENFWASNIQRFGKRSVRG